MRKKFLILLSALLLSAQAQAALVATPGNTILADTTILLEDGLTNNEQEAFNEVQGYTLGSDLTFTNHYGSTTIVAGTTVDSHIIFGAVPDNT